MADSKPTIIFVPGAWHSPEVFSTVRTSLETHGYRTLGITLPSVGAEPPLKTWDPDVDAIRAAIQKAVDEEGGRDVVLAVHSYGGLPASEACKGFAKADREKSGSKGGVVRLVYICAALVNVGTRMVDLSTAGDLQKMAKIDVRCSPSFPFPPRPPLRFLLYSISSSSTPTSHLPPSARQPQTLAHPPLRLPRAIASFASRPRTTSTTTSRPPPPSIGLPN